MSNISNPQPKSRQQTLWKNIFLTLAVILLLIAGIAVGIWQSKGQDEITVKIIRPSDSAVGGSTTYETSGAQSDESANKAILMQIFANEDNGNSFRDIAETEAEQIAADIKACGYGVITSSFAGGPPEPSGAYNWHNFNDANSNYMIVYMLNDKFYVECED